MTSAIVIYLVQAFGATLATALAGYLMAFLHKKLQQAGIELTAAQDARLQSITEDAITAVEERALRAAKAKAAQPLPTSEVATGVIPAVSSTDKHLAAANMVFQIAQEQGLKIDPSKASNAIDRVLPRVRARFAGLRK